MVGPYDSGRFAGKRDAALEPSLCGPGVEAALLGGPSNA
jgi:hypothetical protein